MTNFWCDSQLMPSRQIDGGDGRLARARRGPLQALQHLERALVAELAEREDGVLLQRAVELGDLDDRREARRPRV